MRSPKTLLAALILAALPAVSSTAFARVVEVWVNTPPPPARYEALPPPRHGYVWAPGYWGWHHHQHHWVAGHWERTHVGHHYVPARWVERNGRWYFEQGGWR
jgi:hypothetical protein